jgi:hypothetical protein
MDGGDDDAREFPLSTYFYIPLQPSLAYVNQPKAFVSSEGYHVVIEPFL